jgi:hypothetical protein
MPSSAVKISPSSAAARPSLTSSRRDAAGDDISRPSSTRTAQIPDWAADVAATRELLVTEDRT